MPTAIGDILGYNGRERGGIEAEETSRGSQLIKLHNYADAKVIFTLFPVWWSLNGGDVDVSTTPSPSMS